MLSCNSAKKLKKAGFPQVDYIRRMSAMCACACGNMGGCSCGCHKPPEGKTPNIDVIWSDVIGKWTDIELRHPSLSELIEACGNKFEGVWRRVDKDLSLKEWVANGFIDGSIDDMPFGNTPEEAVSKLWLKLNEK